MTLTSFIIVLLIVCGVLTYVDAWRLRGGLRRKLTCSDTARPVPSTNRFIRRLKQRSKIVADINITQDLKSAHSSVVNEDSNKDGSAASLKDCIQLITHYNENSDVGMISSMDMLSKAICPFKVNEVDPSIVQKSVGIDLGTTFSSVAIIEQGRPKLVPVDGHRLLHSIVAYAANSSIAVGAVAKIRLAADPLNAFASIKRVIGRNFEESQRQSPNKIEKNRIQHAEGNSSITLTCPSINRGIQPEEVSAEVLKVLVRAAEDYLQQSANASGDPRKVKVTSAVITVPAYFLPSQCDATKRAAELAGLQRVKLLREPEAAALAYGITKRDPKIVMVFDLGGGTFDVSILDVGNGFVEVIATGGDAHLGGDDFDWAIVDWMCSQITSLVNQHTVDCMRRDPVVMAKLKDLAETAKINLSTSRSTNITIDGIIPQTDQQPYPSLTIQLTRSKYEDIVKRLLNRLLSPIREAAVMAGINLPGESGKVTVGDDTDHGDATSNHESNPKTIQRMGRQQAKQRQQVMSTSIKELKRLRKELGDPQLSMFPSGRPLDAVVLVGGSSRIPAVQRMVKTVTGMDPVSRADVNPDEAVTVGAAILAGILDGDLPNMQVLSPMQAAVVRAMTEYRKEFLELSKSGQVE